LDPAGQAKLAEVKEKMGMLERTLEQDVARRNSKSSNKSVSTLGLLSSPSLPGQDDHVSDQEDEEDVKGLEPSTLATEDAAYYEDEGNDDIVDLGISMGKLRITERIGGFVRPRFSQEVCGSAISLYTNVMYSPLSSLRQLLRKCQRKIPAIHSYNNPQRHG
jgi:hypothetical protein